MITKFVWGMYFLKLTRERYDMTLYTVGYIPAPVAQVVECRFREREITCLILGRDIPKSLKIVLVAPRLALRLTGESYRTGRPSVRII